MVRTIDVHPVEIARGFDASGPITRMIRHPAEPRHLAADCGCAPGHHMELTTQACAHCGLTEMELAEHGNRPCARGLWPRDVTVPPRPMPGRHRDAPVGTEEGDPCQRDIGGRWCMARIELLPDASLGGCHCASMSMPPCSSCTSTMPECPSCGWREGD